MLLLHEGVGPFVGVVFESGHPAVVDGSVDERCGHVLVAKDSAPSAGFDVGGVDDALGLVCIGGDLEQESATLLIDGYIA